MMDFQTGAKREPKLDRNLNVLLLFHVLSGFDPPIGSMDNKSMLSSLRPERPLVAKTAPGPSPIAPGSTPNRDLDNFRYSVVAIASICFVELFSVL